MIFSLYSSVWFSKLKTAWLFLNSCLLEYDVNGHLQKMLLSKRAHVEQTQVFCLILTYSWQWSKVLSVFYHVHPSPSGYLEAFSNCLYHLHLSSSKMLLKPAQYVTFRIPAATARIKIHRLRCINSLTKPYKICISLWVPGLFFSFIPPPFKQSPSYIRADIMWKDASLSNEWWTHEWPVFIIDKPIQLPTFPTPPWPHTDNSIENTMQPCHFG